MANQKKTLQRKRKRRVNKNLNSSSFHDHYITTGSEYTDEYNGEHTHLFIINGLPRETSWDGNHKHKISTETGRLLPEEKPHKHMLTINGVQYETQEGSPHLHEIQTERYSSFSGSHRHKIVMEDGTEYESILPSDLLQNEVRKRVNIEIQSVFVSSLFLSTVDEAIQFMDDRGFITRDVEISDLGYNFKQLSRERFKEESLKEIELQNGVKAIIGQIDPEKMSDANLTLDSIMDMDIQSDILNDEQVTTLAMLQDAYAAMVVDMKEKAELFIPILNQFIDLSDDFINNDVFNDFLQVFVDTFGKLNGEIQKINIPNTENLDYEVGISKNSNFEDCIRAIHPVLKSLSDIFVDSESFDNLGRIFLKNEALFKQMILNLPMIREEGSGTIIEKAINTEIDLNSILDDELETWSKDDIKALKFKKLELRKLKDSESLNDNLKAILNKIKVSDDINIDLGCGENKLGDFIGIDKNMNSDCDLCYDIDDGLPLPTNSVDKINATNTLEFLKDKSHYQIFDEVSRVLKDKGIFELEAVSTESSNSFLPCYSSYWNDSVIKHLVEKSDFEIEKLETIENETHGRVVKASLKRKDRT